jgi:diadenosine tetraphosphate (Ap4A) HIT family hydrolase
MEAIYTLPMFTLHPQLEKDCTPLGTLGLCRVLLMDNALFPWVILVPERVAAREIIDLHEDDQQLLMQEIASVSRFLKEEFTPDKLNVAALGNQVPQLHIHIIARYKTDEAWPNPVWGRGHRSYTAEEKAALMERLSGLRK